MRTTLTTVALAVLLNGCATTVTVVPAPVEPVQQKIVRLKVSVRSAIQQRTISTSGYGFASVSVLPAESVVVMIRNEVGKALPPNVVLVDDKQDAILEVWQIYPVLRTPWWSVFTGIISLSFVIPAYYQTKCAARLTDNQGNILFTYNVFAEWGKNRMNLSRPHLTVMDWDEFAKQLGRGMSKVLRPHSQRPARLRRPTPLRSLTSQERTDTMKKLIIGSLLATALAACGPGYYENLYVSPRAKMTQFNSIAIVNEGFLPDNFIYLLSEGLGGRAINGSKGDLIIRIVGAPIPFAAGPGGFTVFISNITVEAIRASDNEVVYSIVRNYPFNVTVNKQGAVTSVSGGLMKGVAADIAAKLTQNVLAGAGAARETGVATEQLAHNEAN